MKVPTVFSLGEDRTFPKGRYKLKKIEKHPTEWTRFHVRRTVEASASQSFETPRTRENQGEYVPWRAMARNDARVNEIPVDDKNRNQFLERRVSAGVRQTLSRIDSCISMACQSGRARYSRKMIISGCLPRESFSGTDHLSTDSGSTTLHACTRPVLLEKRRIFLVSPNRRLFRNSLSNSEAIP